MAESAKVITDEADVPDGYVPLANWADDGVNHKRLSDAHSTGRVRAVKLMRTVSEARTGKVWVNEADALRYIEQLEGLRKPKVQVPASDQSSSEADEIKCEGDSLASQAADIRVSLTRCCAYLGDIYDVLESIARATQATARAVEEIATQPQEQQ
jgi:hypothetical protein